MFIAGLNACQIDGDNEWGYKYFGAEAGIGALARFHDVVSVSMEMDYSMKGARARLPSTADVSERYNVQWDYISVPVALNAHVKDLVMFSAGLAPGVMVRYKEFNYDGINVTVLLLMVCPKNSTSISLPVSISLSKSIMPLALNILIR